MSFLSTELVMVLFGAQEFPKIIRPSILSHFYPLRVSDFMWTIDESTNQFCRLAKSVCKSIILSHICPWNSDELLEGKGSCFLSFRGNSLFGSGRAGTKRRPRGSGIWKNMVPWLRSTKRYMSLLVTRQRWVTPSPYSKRVDFRMRYLLSNRYL